MLRSCIHERDMARLSRARYSASVRPISNEMSEHQLGKVADLPSPLQRRNDDIIVSA